jgi:hypothetical protein
LPVQCLPGSQFVRRDVVDELIVEAMITNECRQDGVLLQRLFKVFLKQLCQRRIASLRRRMQSHRGLRLREFFRLSIGRVSPAGAKLERQQHCHPFSVHERRCHVNNLPQFPLRPDGGERRLSF